MLKHIVMWRLRQENREANMQELKRRLEVMRGKIEGLQQLEVGINVIHGESACDLALYAVFDNEQALADYNRHPEHLAIKALIKDIRLTRHQVDYLD